MVADEQGAFHGAGGDDEVLEDEAHEKDADGEDGADGGERFEGGLDLGVLFLGFDLLLGRRVGLCGYGCGLLLDFIHWKSFSITTHCGAADSVSPREV